MCCKWNDRSTSWDKLSNLKELHQIQVANYVIVQGIQNNLAFNWWVHHVLNRRDRVVSIKKRKKIPFGKMP